jgi:hypothetical protein
VGATAPIIYLNSTNAEASARNWAITTNELVWADFDIRQSNSKGATPIGASGTSRFYIDGTGKVGIGTTTPAYKFHVKGTGATYAIIEDVSGNQGLQFKKGGSQTWFIVSEPGSSDRLVIQDADSNAGVTLAQDGTSWGAYSDIRMKKNIEKIDNALEKVNSIRGIKYQKKNQTSNKTYLGVIAQEVELHFPEIIDTDGQGYKSVQYSLITPILIEAIKELNTKTETQNSAIQEQQVQIESLKLLICPDNPNAEICNQ